MQVRGPARGGAGAAVGVRVRAGRRAVEITHPERVLFPRDGITKGDLARYYADVSHAMLVHVKGRPLTLFRYRDGIDRAGFVQQRLATGDAPDWVGRVATPRANGTGGSVLAERGDPWARMGRHRQTLPELPW